MVVRDIVSGVVRGVVRDVSRPGVLTKIPEWMMLGWNLFQSFFDGQTSGTISVSVDYGTGSSYVVGGDGVVDLSVSNRKALFLYCHPDKIVCTPSSGFSYNISMKQVYKP